MSYLTRAGVARTLHRMKEFEAALKKTFEDYRLSFRENSGRRNVLMSQAQEVFFADLLCETGYKAICDGRTGEAGLHRKLVDILKSKPRNAFRKISYSIYETELPDFGFVVAHTNATQTNKDTLDKLEQE